MSTNSQSNGDKKLLLWTENSSTLIYLTVRAIIYLYMTPTESVVACF